MFTSSLVMLFFFFFFLFFFFVCLFVCFLMQWALECQDCEEGRRAEDHRFLGGCVVLRGLPFCICCCHAHPTALPLLVLFSFFLLSSSSFSFFFFFFFRSRCMQINVVASNFSLANQACLRMNELATYDWMIETSMRNIMLIDRIRKQRESLVCC